jgi:F-type H+-transporting ATPase subunit b
VAVPVNAVAPAAAGGMPQFDIAQWPGEIVWALVIFGALYWLLAKIFLPRVAAGIDEREDRISGEIGEARRLREEAQGKLDIAAGELGLAKARARAVAEEAIAEAKSAGRARRADEDAKLAATLAEADGEIDRARDEAMAHVRAIAAEIAVAMVARLTGSPASAAEISAARRTLGTA